MSDEGWLGRIRARAAHIKHEGEHHAHESHEHDKKDGARAARADLSRIGKEIEKRMDKKVLGSTKLGKHVASQGSGVHTWAMPHDFRSSASGIPHQVLRRNSHAFLEVYRTTLMQELGKDFFVALDGHGSDTRILITWAPDPKPHGH